MKVRRAPSRGQGSALVPPFPLNGASLPRARASHTTRMRLAVQWSVVGFAVAISLLSAISANAGYPLPAPHTQGIALIAVSLLAILLWPLLGERKAARIATVALALFLSLTLHSLYGAVLSPLPLFLVAAGKRTESEPRRILCRRMALTLSLFSLYLLVESSGLLYPDISTFCWRLSAAITGLKGTAVRLGPFQIGSAWMVLGILLWITPILCAPRSRRIAIIALWTAPLLVAGALVSLYERQLALLLITLCLIAAASSLSAGDDTQSVEAKAAPESAPGSRFRSRVLWRSATGAFLLVGSVATLLLVCLGSAPRRGGAANLRIAIVDGGLKTLEIPSASSIHASVEAEFGALTPLLAAYDMPSCILPAAFSPGALSGVGLIVIINPTKNFAPAQTTAIRRFVASGGALLILGDHTDIQGIRGPLNDLLSFTGIRFENDSAIPLDQHTRWVNCLRGMFHPAFLERDNSQFGISVGASLSCDSRARVLVVGDRAFSDSARPWFGVSHLGNMSYDFGERLGGLPLVAEQIYGKGVVQVWGDTSGFQNTQLTKTSAEMAALLRFLRDRQPLSFPRAPLAALIFLTGALGLCLLFPDARATGIAWAALLAVVAAAQPFAPVPCAPPTRPQAVVVLDGSHASRYPQSDPNLEIHTFSETCLRGGYSLFQSAPDAQGLANAIHPKSGARPAAVVLLAPTLPYRQDEALLLHRYVVEGGRLLILGSYPQRQALLPVLARFSLDIAPDPFGAAHNARLVAPWRADVLREEPGDQLRAAAADWVALTEAANNTAGGADQKKNAAGSIEEEEMRRGRVKAYDAEIALTESYPILASAEAIPLIVCWDRPLAVRQRVGKGSVTFIADARFVTGKSLGWKEPLNVRSIRFLLHCLEP